MPDNLEQQIENTVQSAVREPTNDVSSSLLFWMAAAGETVSPWWSVQRDKELAKFWPQCNHLASAFWMIGTKLTSIPRRIEPRDSSIKSHIRQADYYNQLLFEGIQFGQGWTDFWMRFFLNLWTQDNGAFAEVVGDGDVDGPIEGPVLGASVLDSARCQRTSDPIYPVVYTDTDDRKYKFHYSRIMFASQMPSPRADMHGVGFSWTTRAINKAQELIDETVYKQEKLGSRPPRQIVLGRGMSLAELQATFRAASDNTDDRGLARFAMTILVASKNPAVDLETIDLTGLPDGFDERTSTELAMALIALAGGFPPRWIWPGTSTGVTKADAMYQHIAGSGGGASYHIGLMSNLLGGDPTAPVHTSGKVLPPHLKIVFDYQDDEQDRMKAEIRKERAATRERNLNTGMTSIRVEREGMLHEGEISKSQFEELELEDGRLPNGDSVLTLFKTTDEMIAPLLDLGLDEPLLINMHDPLDALIAIELAAVNAQGLLADESVRPRQRDAAQQALSALAKLKDIYQSIAIETVQEEVTAEEEGAEEGEEEGEAGGGAAEGPENAEQNPEEEQAEKAMELAWALKGTGRMTNDQIVDYLEKEFNFGARIGEIIRGKLARGAGGRFMNVAELEAQRKKILGRLVDKLRGRATSGAGGSGGSGGSGGGGKKKKPSGGGGGGGKVSPEAKAREAGMAAANKRSAGFYRAINEYGLEGVSEDDLEAMSRFSVGGLYDRAGNKLPIGDLEPDQAQRLAQAGLVKFSTDGKPLPTAAGKALAKAAGKGDDAKIRDAVEKGRQRVEKVRERQAKKIDQANGRRERAREYEAEADELTREANGVERELKAEMGELKSDAQEDLDAISKKLGDKLDDLRADLDGAESPEAKERIRERISSEIEKAEERKAKVRERLAERQEKAQERADKRRERLEERAARKREQAAEQNERADEYEADADEIGSEYGLGGGTQEDGEAASPQGEEEPEPEEGE